MGICYQGKTLKEAVVEKDTIYKKTGYCYGLEKLQLLEEDPAKFMRFQMKLVAACVSVRETARLITANPAAVVMGEIVFMLATPEGDCVAASYGLVGHVQCFTFIARSIARLDFEDDPGINEGDIFFCNDPMYGPPHLNDCYNWIPIFHEGELIAWAVGCNHILDVGAFQTGGLGTISFDTFTDGFTCPPFKTGENFREHHWWELFWKRRTRSSSLNILDDKMRVAGSVALHTKISEIVEEFGVDYFREGIREILEMERRVLLQRIKTQAVPGTYQYRYFWPVRYKGIAGKLFSDSDKDWVLNVPTALTIRPDGTMYVDLEGLTSEHNFYANSYEGAVRMVSSLGQWAMFAHSPNINTALQYISDWNIPPGSLCNPQNPYSAASLTMGPSKFNFMFREVYSRAYFARGFLEECYPGGSSGSIFGETGIFNDGTRWGAGDWSMVGAEATAGLPFKDGEVTSYSGPNPQCDSGEIELAEFMAPTNLTFGKRLVPNFCGHGKFRSGLGTGTCFMVLEPGKSLNVNIFLATHGAGHLCTGMSGGYLTPEGVVLIVRGTNMREVLEKGGKYPRDMIEIRQWLKEGKLKAESEQLYTYSTPNIELKDGDLFTMIAGAKGGWGDPLEREFSRLEKDVHYGWLTPDAIKSVYGAVIDEKGKVKVAESNKLRQQIRDRRRERSVPVKDWWHKERKKVLNKEFSSEEVRYMYADCMKYKKFDEEFRNYHHLPEDYRL